MIMIGVYPHTHCSHPLCVQEVLLSRPQASIFCRSLLTDRTLSAQLTCLSNVPKNTPFKVPTRHCTKHVLTLFISYLLSSRGLLEMTKFSLWPFHFIVRLGAAFRDDEVARFLYRSRYCILIIATFFTYFRALLVRILFPPSLEYLA